MFKRLIIVMLLLLGTTYKMFCQDTTRPFIEGYKNREYWYFDSVHKAMRSVIAEVDSMREFYVAFRVDTNGAVVDLTIEEVPVPQPSKRVWAYIADVFGTTNGKWQPATLDGKKVLSREFICFLSMVNDGQSVEERTKEGSNFFEKSLSIVRDMDIERRYYLQKWSVIPVLSWVY